MCIKELLIVQAMDPLEVDSDRLTEQRGVQVQSLLAISHLRHGECLLDNSVLSLGELCRP